MERPDEVQELNHVAIDLLVTVGLLASVMENYPDEVQDGFDEKVLMLKANLIREMEEFQLFGEGFDN